VALGYFCDFDDSLAGMKPRDAPLYIEPVPKRGYRFIAPVSQTTESRNAGADTEGGAVAAATNETTTSRAFVAAPDEIPVSNCRPSRNATGIGLKLGLIFWIDVDCGLRIDASSSETTLFRLRCKMEVRIHSLSRLSPSLPR